MNAAKIGKLINLIGKIKITLDSTTKDYLYNGLVPSELNPDHFSVLLKNYKKNLFIQLKENCDNELIDNYLKKIEKNILDLKNEADRYRVDFLYSASTIDKSTKQPKLSETAAETNVLITKIIEVQEKVLRIMKSQLLEIAEYKNYQISSDFNIELDYQDLDTNIDSLSLAKATFNLSKKDVVLLFYTLEKTGLLAFENDVQRNKFIENNFNYTEIRENANKGKTFEIKSVNEEISKLKSSVPKQLKSNYSSKEELLSSIYEQIHNYDFKS